MNNNHFVIYTCLILLGIYIVTISGSFASFLKKEESDCVTFSDLDQILVAFEEQIIEKLLDNDKIYNNYNKKDFNEVFVLNYNNNDNDNDKEDILGNDEINARHADHNELEEDNHSHDTHSGSLLGKQNSFLHASEASSLNIPKRSFRGEARSFQTRELAKSSKSSKSSKSKNSGSGKGSGSNDNKDNLLERLQNLESITKCINKISNANDIYFRGCNVHVENGLGATNKSVPQGYPGLGNLIVGYNQNSSEVMRSGSHNIIVGDDHEYTSTGGIVAGQGNTISGMSSSVTGGTGNTASASYSSVTGGKNNKAAALYASVSGGSSNTAFKAYASVTGGRQNKARAMYASVTGGWQNMATSKFSSVSGGEKNEAAGIKSSVTGGSNNKAIGTDSSISGGDNNTANGTCATVIGSNSRATERDLQVEPCYVSCASKEVTKLACVHEHSTGKDLYFRGCNVHVENNLGSTSANVVQGDPGLGNLIVGYNHDSSSALLRNGSHNIIVGDDHEYTSYGGIVAGQNNTISGPSSSVTGGEGNTASASYASVTGGVNNSASAPYASVTGGSSNLGTGSKSSVTGGRSNEAAAEDSSISGGDNNTANVTGACASIIGGSNKTTTVDFQVQPCYVGCGSPIVNKLSCVSTDSTDKDLYFRGCNVHVENDLGSTSANVVQGDPGLGNLIVGYNHDSSSTLLRNGSHNLIVGDEHAYSSYGGIVAGKGNIISGQYSCVTGGQHNEAAGNYASVAGGQENIAISEFSSITGGNGNLVTISGTFGSVTGGQHNIATGEYSSVTGGFSNSANGEYSSITGGHENEAVGKSGSVTGGYNNKASGEDSSVTGGSSNVANGSKSSITGGESNLATGEHARVTGGQNNKVHGQFAGISGGQNNVANASWSQVF